MDAPLKDVVFLTVNGTIGTTVSVVYCNSMVINHCGTGGLPKIILALVVRDAHECEGEDASHSFAQTTNSNTGLFCKMGEVLSHHPNASNTFASTS